MTTETVTKTAIVNPYLDFEGKCEEALHFYQKALGAEIDTIMRFSECPDPIDPAMVPPGNENKVMHSQFRIGDSVLLASDCNCSGNPSFAGTSLALTAPSIESAETMFNALAESGQVHCPLAKTFFAETFGVVADKFGITWMILANLQPQETCA